MSTPGPVAPRDQNDLGIVLSLNGTAVGTYVDIEGITRNFGQLDGTFRAMASGIETAHPWVSGASGASMFVLVSDISPGDTVTVRCRQGYANAYPAFLTGWFDFLWARQDTTTNQIAKEFTFTENGLYLLQTPSALLGDELEFSAKTTSAESEATVVIGCKVAF